LTIELKKVKSRICVLNIEPELHHLNYNSFCMIMKASPKKTRKEKEVEQRKSYIMSCAEELFAELGYNNTSLVMIAEKSEFAVGSVYNFFNSKNDIFNAIILQKLNEASERVFAISDKNIPADSKIKGVIADSFDFFSRNESFVKIYLYELTRLGWGLPTDLSDEVGTRLFGIISKLEDMIIQGQKENVLRNDIDYQRITMTFLQITISYLAFWIKEEKTTDLNSYSDEMYEIFMNGIGARK